MQHAPYWVPCRNTLAASNLRSHEKIPLHSLHEFWMHLRSNAFFIISPLCSRCLCRLIVQVVFAQFVMLCPRILVSVSSFYLTSFKPSVLLSNTLFLSPSLNSAPMLRQCLAAISASDKWRHSAALFNIPLVNCPFNHSRLKHSL